MPHVVIERYNGTVAFNHTEIARRVVGTKRRPDDPLTSIKSDVLGASAGANCTFEWAISAEATEKITAHWTHSPQRTSRLLMERVSAGNQAIWTCDGPPYVSARRPGWRRREDMHTSLPSIGRSNTGCHRTLILPVAKCGDGLGGVPSIDALTARSANFAIPAPRADSFAAVIETLVG